jgi:hypothetical protein
MKFEISISERETYLSIRVKETVTAELLRGFIGKTAERSKKSGIIKFLFDLRQAPNQTSLGVHYDFVYERSRELGFEPRSKHALLVSSEHTYDYSFVETILLNAGYQSKMFTDERDAIEWVEE